MLRISIPEIATSELGETHTHTYSWYCCVGHIYFIYTSRQDWCSQTEILQLLLIGDAFCHGNMSFLTSTHTHIYTHVHIEKSTLGWVRVVSSWKLGLKAALQCYTVTSKADAWRMPLQTMPQFLCVAGTEKYGCGQYFKPLPCAVLFFISVLTESLAMNTRLLINTSEIWLTCL